MVALLASVISSFRCVLSPLIRTLSLKSTANYDASVVHPWNLPLPPVLHQTLSEEFVKKFDEIVVIGDVHGCYDELIQLLSQINCNNNVIEHNECNNNNQNNRRILMLFVGDIVNKGPKNSEVIEFMLNNRDTCLSVRGNHDEVVVREYLKHKKGETLIDKNEWVKALSHKQIDYLLSLPYSIRIPYLNVIVVHAGLVPSVPLKSQKIVDLINMRNLIVNGNEMTGTANDNEGVEWNSLWKGPEHVFFGHDAKRKLQKSKFSTGLDTGCVYGNALTAVAIFGPRKGTFFTVNANKVYSEPKGND